MKMQLPEPGNLLNLWEKVEVQEVGAFQQNKYSFVQVKDGGTYFFGAWI